MAKNEALKNRYPGLQPFGKQESMLFFGRDLEKGELFDMVTLEKVVVLFGKSGLGKSSLLNAGLSPMLEANGYVPVRVRFSPGNRPGKDNEHNENFLIRDFIIAFNGFDTRSNILFDKENPQLWEYIKAARFVNEKGESRLPVFIFDQFEEFFYHPTGHQEAFLRQLSEVVHEQPPRRILAWATNIDEDARTEEQIAWHKQPDVKIIFSLRSDKLALMQQLVQHIGTVLRNRYELKPLNLKQAADAIEQPAGKELGADYTPKFGFKKELVQSIVTELSNNANEIESSQLQMVCNYIENRVTETGTAEVTESIIVPATDIPKIRDNFYEVQLAKITDDGDRMLARKVIEDDMVIDGQRASLLQKQLLSKLKGKRELVDALVNARLIREENTNRGITYEVSHDTLISTIEKSKRIRQAGEEELRKEEERVKLETENARMTKEAEEKNARIAEESRLRQMAETQREEAERQRFKAEALREEADRQRKRAHKYIIFSVILGFLSLAGGIYFFTTERNKKIKAEDRSKDIQLKANELSRQTVETLQKNKPETLDTNNVAESREDTADLQDSYLLIKQARDIDTTNTEADVIIDKIYKKAQLKKADEGMKAVPVPPKEISTQEKMQIIEQKIFKNHPRKLERITNETPDPEFQQKRLQRKD